VCLNLYFLEFEIKIAPNFFSSQTLFSLIQMICIKLSLNSNANNLLEMTFRAYITGKQLTQIKLGQKVKVFVDNVSEEKKEIHDEIYLDLIKS